MPLAPDTLLVEERDDPGIGSDKAGVENPYPVFSWTADPITAQTAYRLLLADNSTDIDNDYGNIWDSGKISITTESCIYDSTHTLQSNIIYRWKVKTWDI